MSMIPQIITRDSDSIPTKPDPAAVMHICSHWGLSPRATLMVGDDWKDIMCGNKAGSGKQDVLNIRLFVLQLQCF